MINIEKIKQKYPGHFKKKRKHTLCGINCDNPPPPDEILEKYKNKLSDFLETENGLNDITSVIADNLTKLSPEKEIEELIHRFITVNKNVSAHLKTFFSKSSNLYKNLMKDHHIAVRLLCLMNKTVLHDLIKYSSVIDLFVNNINELRAFFSMLVFFCQIKENMLYFFFSALPEIHINMEASTAKLFEYIEYLVGTVRVNSYNCRVSNIPDNRVELGRNIYFKYKPHLITIQLTLAERLFWLTELTNYYSIARFSLEYIKSDADAEKVYKACKTLYETENGFNEHGPCMEEILLKIVPLMHNIDDFVKVCKKLPFISVSLIESKAKAGSSTLYSYYWQVLKENISGSPDIQSFLSLF